MDPKSIEERITPAVNRVIRFFEWTPSWLVGAIAGACWVSTIVTIFLLPSPTFTQSLIFGLGASVIGTICMMAYMIKNP